MSDCSLFDVVMNAPPKWVYGYWSRVDVGSADQCWRWRGHYNRGNGYGRLKAPSGGDWVYAHRTSLILHRKTPIGELYACHKCDNPSCCNPYHIYAGTQSQNMQDRNKIKEPGRLARVRYAK